MNFCLGISFFLLMCLNTTKIRIQMANTEKETYLTAQCQVTGSLSVVLWIPNEVFVCLDEGVWIRNFKCLFNYENVCSWHWNAVENVCLSHTKVSFGMFVWHFSILQVDYRWKLKPTWKHFVNIYTTIKISIKKFVF